MFPEDIFAHLPSRAGQGLLEEVLGGGTVSLASATYSLTSWALPGPCSWGRISLLIIC